MGENVQQAWQFPDAEQQKADMLEKGLLFAEQYTVFGGPTADPRARAILDHWTEKARCVRIAVNASAQEYAAHNAFRELVEGIHRQLAFASQGQNLPKPRTK